jgi:hypothetical protein
MRQFFLTLLHSLQILVPPTWQIQSDEGCGADPDGKPRCSP